jgi:hypothetical protein
VGNIIEKSAQTPDDDQYQGFLKKGEPPILASSVPMGRADGNSIEQSKQPIIMSSCHQYCDLRLLLDKQRQ